MPVIDRVKWDAKEDEYAYKYPSEDLSTWTQLIVSESQEAVLVKEGKMVGPFKAGRHTLDTKNFPFLSNLFSLPFGKKSAFTAEVWFVNRSMPLNVTWNTVKPIRVKDPLGFVVPITANGQYGVQIADTKRFLVALVGTLSRFDRETLTSHFRSMVLTHATDLMAKAITQDRISSLEIAAHQLDLSKRMQESLTKDLDEFGVRMVRFYLESVGVADGAPDMSSTMSSWLKKQDMEIQGYTYHQERTFNTLERAASNESGVAQSMIGAGIGMGVGVSMGNAMAPMARQLVEHSAPRSVQCPKCRGANQSGDSYCNSCGTPLKGVEQARDASSEAKCATCPACRAAIQAETKFCGNCGQSLRKCSGCSALALQNAKRCGNCGLLFPETCPQCSASLDPGMKFCGMCGERVSKSCSQCGTDLNSSSRFCGNCGADAEANGGTK